MSLLAKLRLASLKGEKLALDEGFAALPVDPFWIAASREIEVQAKPAEVEGVSGMLLRHGNAFGIMYATNVPSVGFQRFSVAHELGHYFLDGHVDHVFARGDFHVSHACYVSGDPYEMEADHFASGLLMPERLFKPLLSKHDPGLAMIEDIAGKAQTSLTATAIRCAQLSRDALAVVISTGDTVDYCFMSEGMKVLPNLSFIRKGSRVPPNTATARLNDDPKRVLTSSRYAQEIDSMDWLGGSRSARLNEEVLGLGSYGKTLTVLSSSSLGAVDDGHDEDEEQERDLIEKYTPRFRR